MPTDRELMQQALDALEYSLDWSDGKPEKKAIEALRARLAQPEQPQIVWIDNKQTGNFLNIAPPQREWQYRRGDRLLCLETEEHCVIHVAGTNRQWVKFPDSHVGVYTNEQVAEMFELLPKEREWQGLTDEEIQNMWSDHCKNWQRAGKILISPTVFGRAIEAKLKEKNT